MPGDQQATVREVMAERFAAHISDAPWPHRDADTVRRAQRCVDEAFAALDREGWVVAPKEPVAWERKSAAGWVSVSPEDIPHYRSTGQDIRYLAAIPQPQGGEND